MTVTIVLIVAMLVSLALGIRKGQHVKTVWRPLFWFVASLLGAILGFYMAPDFKQLIKGSNAVDDARCLIAAVLILNGLLMPPNFAGQALGPVIRYWLIRVSSKDKNP